MIRKFMQLVLGIWDGTGKVDPRWAEISWKNTGAIGGLSKELLDNGFRLCHNLRVREERNELGLNT